MDNPTRRLIYGDSKGVERILLSCVFASSNSSGNFETVDSAVRSAGVLGLCPTTLGVVHIVSGVYGYGSPDPNEPRAVLFLRGEEYTVPDSFLIAEDPRDKSYKIYQYRKLEPER